MCCRCEETELVAGGNKHLLYNESYDNVMSFDTVMYSLDDMPCAVGGSFSMWEVSFGDRDSQLDGYTWPGALILYLSTHTTNAATYVAPSPASVMMGLVWGYWAVWLPPIPFLVLLACIIWGWWKELPCFKRKEPVLIYRQKEYGQDYDEFSKYGAFDDWNVASVTENLELELDDSRY